MMNVDKGPLQDQVIRSRQLPLPPSAGAARALARHFGDLLRLIGRTNQLLTALNRQTKRPVLAHSARKRTGRKPPGAIIGLARRDKREARQLLVGRTAIELTG